MASDHERIQPFRYGDQLCKSLFRMAGFENAPDNLMANANREIRRKEITELARRTWSQIWSDPMPADWRVYLVRKTVIQRVHGRSVCGVILRRDKLILVGRHTKHDSFQTLVHELAHLRTLEESLDHGPAWEHEFNRVARPLLGSELQRDI
jgi:hypothetical protein